MRLLLIVLGLVLVLAACSGASEPSTTTTMPVAAATTVPSTTTTTVEPGLEPCPEVDYRPTTVPVRAAGEAPEIGAVALDDYMAIAGTSIRVWTDEEGEPVMTFIRGSLPPEQWRGPAVGIEVVGQEAALGRLPDDVWAVAWFESENRCDSYTLVVYPPTSGDEVRQVAESIIPSR